MRTTTYACTYVRTHVGGWIRSCQSPPSVYAFMVVRLDMILCESVLETDRVLVSCYGVEICFQKVLGWLQLVIFYILCAYIIWSVFQFNSL